MHGDEPKRLKKAGVMDKACRRSVSKEAWPALYINLVYPASPGLGLPCGQDIRNARLPVCS